MSEVVQAWAFVSALIGGGWALVMMLGLLATPRDFMRARVLMGTMSLLGLALLTVGVVGLS